MTHGDCNLHENQRIAGTLCRSMHCTKCPPYKEPPQEESKFSKSEMRRLENQLSDRWRDKYYDKVAELNLAEEKILTLIEEIQLHIKPSVEITTGALKGAIKNSIDRYHLTDV